MRSLIPSLTGLGFFLPRGFFDEVLLGGFCAGRYRQASLRRGGDDWVCRPVRSERSAPWLELRCAHPMSRDDFGSLLLAEWTAA